MRRTRSLFDVMEDAPNSWFAREEHGACRTPGKFESTIKSTTSPPSGWFGPPLLTVGLLQALPEGARLKINVLDGADSSHEATFPLAGLDAVREKIAAACKWPPAANAMSSEKR